MLQRAACEIALTQRISQLCHETVAVLGNGVRLQGQHANIDLLCKLLALLLCCLAA